MFIKGRKIYADKGKYLKHKNFNIIGLVLVDNNRDYIEVDMPEDYGLEVDEGKIYLCDRKFIFDPKDLTYSEIKTTVIKSRYSEDDQIALILNKDLSEEGLFLFNKMQEWREFASEIANLVVNY